MAFTDADMEGKRWLADHIGGRRAGLIDGAVNVSGDFLGTTDAPRILVGSHIDTVPCAGSLDGTLGVVAGLGVSAMSERTGVQPQRTIELIAFSDEEGRFGGMFGSQSVIGQLNPESLATMNDLNGVLLRDELQRHGYDPIAALDAARDPESIAAYLELHIEQGPVLDRAQSRSVLSMKSPACSRGPSHCAVKPITPARRRWTCGTMPSWDWPILRTRCPGSWKRTAATAVGRRSARHKSLPGATNTVPGLVEFSLDVRDTSELILDELSTAFRKALSAIARRRNLMFEFEQKSYLQPVACQTSIVNQLSKQAERWDWTTADAQWCGPRCTNHGKHGAGRYDLCPQQEWSKPLTRRMDGLVRHRSGCEFDAANRAAMSRRREDRAAA